ncbi:IS110 family transposase, partial [Staphylococcus epidermidis]
FTHPDMVLDIDKDVLITPIFNSTDKGMSMDKATKYALQLRVITQESYPNVDRHSFLVEKLRLLIQQLKQTIHHLKQLD